MNVYIFLIEIYYIWYRIYESGSLFMPSLLPIFSLRIPEELLEQLKQIAQENCRSTNKEIEYALMLYVKQYNKNKNENK